MTGSTAARSTIFVALSAGIMELRAEFDPDLLPRLRNLPGAHYVPRRHAWRLSASRKALTATAVLRHELSDGFEFACDHEAERRLRRCSPAWVSMQSDGVIIRGPHNAVRARLLHDVPEARYVRAERQWQMPVTRASAAALLHVIDEAAWRFSIDQPTRRTLERVRAGQPFRWHEASAGVESQQARRSPVPHWRHHLRGPIFEANPDRREWVEGIGRCVRVRVSARSDATSKRAAPLPG